MQDTEQISSTATSADLKRDWLHSAPVTWEQNLIDMKPQSIQELADWLDSLAVHAARLSGYLEARGATGCVDNGHRSGVKNSNNKAAKVRKAIGYTQPR